MARVLFIFVLLALAAVGAVWLVDRPDDVTLIWQGLRIETSLAVVAAGIILIAVALALLWSLLRLIGRTPRLLRGGARARLRGAAPVLQALAQAVRQRRGRA